MRRYSSPHPSEGCKAVAPEEPVSNRAILVSSLSPHLVKPLVHVYTRYKNITCNHITTNTTITTNTIIITNTTITSDTTITTHTTIATNTTITTDTKKQLPYPSTHALQKG